MRAWILLTGVLCIFSTGIQATQVITATNAAAGVVQFTPFTVATNDLLQTSVASVAAGGSFNSEGAVGVSSLNDGQFTVYAGGGPILMAAATSGSFVQYDLDLTKSPLGYIITNITTYGGWRDGGRDAQLILLSYSTVGDPNYHGFDLINFNPPSAGGTPSAVQVVVTDPLPPGIDGIRFDFVGNQESGYAGYGEFDVNGYAVPEPTSAALLACGGCIFLATKRSRRKS